MDFPELQPFLAEPQRSALLFDIDGTLAPIVDDPAASAVPGRTRELLDALQRRYGLVACISGRQALEARRIVGLDSIAYVGNHGLEVLAPGAREVATDPELAPLGAAVKEFAQDAYKRGLADLGVRLEDKDVIWAFHWRGVPDETAAREAVAEVASDADRHGLIPHWGRKVLEIRPPVPVDKGQAVRDLVQRTSVRTALFGGDDVTDLDGFSALAALAEEGALDHSVRVGVRSDEGPPEILEQADLVVDGIEGFQRVLAVLVAA